MKPNMANPRIVGTKVLFAILMAGIVFSKTPVAMGQPGKNTAPCSSPCGCSSDDDIWFVSARNYDCPSHDLSGLCCQRWIDGGWQERSLDELVELHHSDALASIVFVHGNRTDEYWAKHRGLDLLALGFPPPECRRPVRLIIWAWCSDRICGPRRDFEIKSERAIRLGSVFAETLERFGESHPVVIGYSLGCQVIAQAFVTHSFSGNEPFRLAFIAPVLNADFSASCCRSLLVSGQVGQAYVLTNPRDPVVRAARRFNRRHTRGQACSFEHWVQRSIQPLGPVQVINVRWETRASHALTSYLESCQLKSQLLQLTAPESR